MLRAIGDVPGRIVDLSDNVPSKLATSSLTTVPKLQATIAFNKEFGVPTDVLETKLRELQAADTKKHLRRGQAPRVARKVCARETDQGDRRQKVRAGR